MNGRRSLLLRGASVLDGIGGQSRRADVAVVDGRIVDIGNISSRNIDGRVVDLGGLVLSPGFIDIHTHSDVSVVHDPACESKVLQGVTTDVIGNCSFSAFPIDPSRRELHRDHLARLGDAPLLATWEDIDGYEHRIAENPLAMNIAPLIGHGTTRVAAMGVDRRPPTDDETSRMKELIRQSLQRGAFGFSTGLTHVPSAYGATEEIRSLLGTVAQNGGLYSTHARATHGNEFAAVVEALDMVRQTGVRLQYSHVALNDPANWGSASQYLDLFDDAIAEGLDVAFDVYPYDASSSSLTQCLPEWLQEGGSEEMRARLNDPAGRARARTDVASGWYGGIPWLWDRVRIARAPVPGISGHTLHEIAQRSGKDPIDVVLDLCADHGNEVEVVLSYRTEEDMVQFLKHPLSTIGSDGSAIPLEQSGKAPHPRHYGTFPRVLGRYVRELGALSLPEAVRKMTGANAQRLGIRDRGIIAEGNFADLVAFDPERVVDTATFMNPCQAPLGIEHVWVAGDAVVSGGTQTTARPGRLLRHEGVAA